MKKIIIDLDNTICTTVNSDYLNSKPIEGVVSKLLEYKSLGFSIVINTSRNMRSYNSNIGVINKKTLPNIVDWLNKNKIPFDEIYVGKPWCGFDGFYVDDKSIRPSEFINLSYDEIKKLLNKEKEQCI